MKSAHLVGRSGRQDGLSGGSCTQEMDEAQPSSAWLMTRSPNPIQKVVGREQITANRLYTRFVLLPRRGTSAAKPKATCHFRVHPDPQHTCSIPDEQGDHTRLEPGRRAGIGRGLMTSRIMVEVRSVIRGDPHAVRSPDRGKKDRAQSRIALTVT